MEVCSPTQSLLEAIPAAKSISLTTWSTRTKWICAASRRISVAGKNWPATSSVLDTFWRTRTRPTSSATSTTDLRKDVQGLLRNWTKRMGKQITCCSIELCKASMRVFALCIFVFSLCVFMKKCTKQNYYAYFWKNKSLHASAYIITPTITKNTGLLCMLTLFSKTITLKILLKCEN